MSGESVIVCGFDFLPDNLVLDIFRYLTVSDLVQIQRVCKRWRRICGDFYLWTDVRITPQRITKAILSKLVKNYFTDKTSSLDLCGAWKWQDKNHTVCLSNHILKNIAKKCPNLKEFKVEEDNLRDIDLSLLPKSIESLSFTRCDIPRKCLAHVSGHFDSLKSLTLRRCPGFGEEHLSSFGKLDSLEKLEFYVCYRMQQSMIEVLAENFPNIRTLALVGSPYLGDEACRVIASRLMYLESLEIDDWLDLSQAAVDILQKSLKHLKFLSVKAKSVNEGRILIVGSRINV